MSGSDKVKYETGSVLQLMLALTKQFIFLIHLKHGKLWERSPCDNKISGMATSKVP